MTQKIDNVFEQILQGYGKELGDNLSKDEIFEHFSATQLLKNHNLDDSEIESGLVGGTLDNGIDGLYIFVDNVPVNDVPLESINKNANDLTVHFHQYKNQYKVEEGVVLKFINAFKDILNFENEDLKGWNEDLKGKILFLRSVITHLINSKHLQTTFVISHVAKGDVNLANENLSYQSKVENLKRVIAESDLNRVNVKYTCIGRELLEALYYQPVDYNLEITLKDSPLTLEFADDNIGYIALVGLLDYYNFITEEKDNDGEKEIVIKEHLFDDNVRAYQNNTNVNKEIEKSIQENTNIDFWWLNNGITIIAGLGSNQLGKTLKLQNVRIVNGLQTFYSIYHAVKEGKVNANDNRSVFVKIIITDSHPTIDKIIRATNSQNAINSSILRSTDYIQREIEAYFYKNDYYYDRRKNYYRNQRKPRNKIISINLLAQCIVSMVIPEKDPSKARSTPTSLIKSDSDYKKIFREDLDFQVYLNSAIIFTQVRDELSSRVTKDKFGQSNAMERLLQLYKFHISRILVSILLSDCNPSLNELKDKQLPEMVKSEDIQKAVELLLEILEKYDKDYAAHLDNISKQSEFSRFITKELAKKYKK